MHNKIIQNKYLNKLPLKYQNLLLQRLTLLTDIGDELYLNNIHNPEPPLKKPRKVKKQHQQEENFKTN